MTRDSATFVDNLEAVVEDVAQFGAEVVEMVVDRLMPDGRPFWMEKKTADQMLMEYTMNLRGNPEAWAAKIREIVEQLMKSLNGLPDDVIASAHPYNIAIAVAIQHSARMEQLLRKQEEEALRPSSSPPPEEMMDDDAGTDERV